MRAAIVTRAFDACAELAAFARARANDGALASFVGYCRGQHGEAAVSALELTHYPGFSDEAILRIGERCAARHAINAGLILHRTGVVFPGDAIVLVAALSPHRADALAAVRPECFTIDTTDPGTNTNVIGGSVAGVSHFGDTLQYVVRTARRDLVVLLPRQQAPKVVPGDHVWCRWASDDVYSFSARQASLVLSDPTTETAGLPA